MHPAADPDRLAGAVAARDRLIWPALLSELVRLHAARSDSGAVDQSPTVLDCGGGSGSLAVPLAMAGAQVTVLDSSADALATLERRAAEAGVAEWVRGIQGDVEDIGVRDSGLGLSGEPSLDMVLAHGVLDETDDPSAVLAQMASLARPGGVVSVVVANPVAAVLARALSGDIAGAVQDLQAHSGGVGTSAQEILASCAAAGLRVEALRGIEVIGGLISGAILESRPSAAAAVAQFEQAVAERDPYRAIAARLHVVARR